MQFIKYCLAGSVAVFVHLAVLVLAVELFSVPPAEATAIGFSIGVLVNYFAQYHWTFSATDSHKTALPAFVAIALAGLALNSCIFWAAAEFFNLPYVASQIVATGLVVLFNFSLNRRYVYTDYRPT